MSPFSAYDVRYLQVVDAAKQVPYPFRISRQLALVPSDVGHTIFK
jgi:hypothetical protein